MERLESLLLEGVGLEALENTGIGILSLSLPMSQSPLAQLAQLAQGAQEPMEGMEAAPPLEPC